jgi:hypothetical protein
MKRQRILLYLFIPMILLGVVLTGYGYYAGQQARALDAARVPSPLVAKYARIQKALHASPESESANVHHPEQSANDEAFQESLEELRHTESLIAKFAGREIGDALRGELLERPISSWSPEDWKRLRDSLAENEDLLAEARRMAEGTGPVYPLDFSEGYSLPLPHLSPIRAMVRLLYANAIALAHGGHIEGASADIMTGLRLGARLEEEPLLISQLVRAAINSIVADGVVQAFPEGQIPPELVADLADYYEAQDLPAMLRESWQSEGAMGQDFLTSIMDGGWQQGREQLEEFWPRDENSIGNWETILYASPLARPWQYQDMLSYNRLMIEFEQTLEMPYYEARDVFERLEEDVAALPFTRLLTRNMLPSMDSILRMIARDQTQRQLLLLGSAVESYANEHGTYPSSLSAVGPSSRDVSTIDPHTGAPFRYEVDGDGFRLYSVGPNLTDNGGDHDLIEGDIVWRGRTRPKRAGAQLAARS